MKITFEVEPYDEEKSKKTIQDLKERFKKRKYRFESLVEEVEKNFKFREELDKAMGGVIDELETKRECENE